VVKFHYCEESAWFHYLACLSVGTGHYCVSELEAWMAGEEKGKARKKRTRQPIRRRI
jgi:hypothetical protein